jgi:hypothetical protein
MIGAVLAAAGVTVAAIIVLTALFGPQQSSERAFRFLRWITNRPEPPQ